MNSEAVPARDPLVKTAAHLAAETKDLRFGPPITHVYSPLVYAWEPHRIYLEKFGGAPKEILLIGMNPGPYGMAQTGVPFGDVAMVRDWMGIEAPVGRPENEHPKRSVLGFACPRSEVSGARLWGWAKQRYSEPEQFFSRFFVYNYCPLCFMESGGRNFTPDKLPAREREPLFAACDRALRAVVDYCRPGFVIGVGHFAEARIRAALINYRGTIGRIPHPSPASPAANRNWAGSAEEALCACGVDL